MWELLVKAGAQIMNEIFINAGVKSVFTEV